MLELGAFGRTANIVRWLNPIMNGLRPAKSGPNHGAARCRSAGWDQSPDLSPIPGLRARSADFGANSRLSLRADDGIQDTDGHQLGAFRCLSIMPATSKRP
jgi:hypothetical protein